MRLLVRLAALAGALAFVPAALAVKPPDPIASDPLSIASGQHHTIVEPDSFASGSTIVAAAQAGRFFDGGATAIAFATSTNNGASWTSGLLPGLTTFTDGTYDAITDPSVAYDKMHNVWLVLSLGLVNGPAGPSGEAVLTSRSTDGGLTWNAPVNTALTTKKQDFDKTWIVCDNTDSSPFYGSCYAQFDDFGTGNLLKMYYSRDGGLTWTASRTPRVGVIGGQPLVLSNGNVVVPLDNASATVVGFTISTNGGVRFGQAFGITAIPAAVDPGSIRSGPLPTAEIAGDNTIYIAWEDCRFRAGCPAAGTPNDIVYVTSSNNGTTWSAVKRVPIDATDSTVDHFLPGIAVDRATSGVNTHVGLVYYYYPDTHCTPFTCQLNVGFVSSANAGTSWSTPTQLAGPMAMSWLPDTSQGRMVGDYMSASFDSGGNVHPVYAVASAPDSGPDCSIATPTCSQALFSDTLAATGGSVSASTDSALVTATAGPGASEFKHSR
jgi:hypothetical protein